MIQRLRNPTMTMSLALFLALTSVLPLLMLGLISDYISRSVIEQEVKNYTRALVNEQREYLDLLFQEIEGLIVNISGVEDIKTVVNDEGTFTDDYTRLSTHAKIGYILSGYIGVKGLVSLDIFTPGSAHYHVGDTLNVQEINQEVLDRLRAEALASDSSVLWPGVEDNVNRSSDHEKVVTAAKLFRTIDVASLQEKPGALLLVNYNVDSLYEHFERLNLGTDAYIIVVDTHQRLVYHPDKANIGQQVSPAFVQRLGAESGTFEMVVDGQRTLVAYTKSAVSGWSLAILVPYSNLMAGADTIRKTTYAVTLLSLLFITLMVVVVSQTVVSPIKRITELFKRIQAGTFDWQMRLPEKRTDEIGELTRWFNTFLDSMEAQHKAEQELLKAKDAAEAANRAKSAFLANMSHELRTPLNAILGFSELMTRDTTLNSSQRDNLEIINRSGEHLLGLINDILEISKIEAGRLDIQVHSFDLYRMLCGLEEMFGIRARQKGLALEVDCDPGVPQYVRTDEGKLRQVLINLLANAVKFTHQGGVILQVGVGTQENRAPGDSPEAFSQFLLRFLVRDTGIGISPEDIERIFKPFVQLDGGKQISQGTGLGLSISQQYVELLGGRLSLQSVLGEGSTFSFDLPVTQGTMLADTPPPSRVLGVEPGQYAADGGPFRLLVVEDVDVNRTFLVKFLRHLGFDVREAVNGFDAVMLWQSWQPHLIFMDLRMPVMDGYEATRRIKALPQGQNTIIIALTASAFEEERSAVIALGCDDFIRKPFRESQICDALFQHLGVRFIYETLQVIYNEPTSSFTPEIAMQAMSLPEAWKANMRHATSAGDMIAAQGLIDEIKTAFPEVAKILAQMVYNFEYERVRMLIDTPPKP